MGTASPKPTPQPQDAVVAFDPSRRAWITAGPPAAQHVPLPALKGSLSISEAALNEASEDFGHVVHRKPSAILRPGSAQDIAEMIRFARRHQLKIGPRGAAHTMFGHAQVPDGIVIDMSSLNGMDLSSLDAPPSAGRQEAQITVDAGAQWLALARATLERGWAPPVLTDYLELSVGGTLAVGGVSGASYLHGVQLDQVLQLEVVTGEGELRSCSPTQNPDLFNATLAGLGQCGIMTRATIRLLPSPPFIRLYDLFYPDLHSLIQDIRKLIEPGDSRFEYLHGFILPDESGKWMYGLRALAYYTPPASPDDAKLLAGLARLPGAQQISDQRYIEFLERMVPQKAELQRTGRYEHAHPWCDLFVKASALETLLGEVLQEVAPAEISSFFPILMYPFKRERVTRPLFRAPAEDSFFLLDILRTAGPGTRSGAELVQHNRKFFERNRELGGTHYSISAIERTHEDWKEHFGSEWEGFAAARRRYDPDSVLTPGPGIFP